MSSLSFAKSSCSERKVNVLRRGSKRPKLHFVDRLKLLLGARWLPSWRRVIVLVQPETVLRWHRAGFRF